MNLERMLKLTAADGDRNSISKSNLFAVEDNVFLGIPIFSPVESRRLE